VESLAARLAAAQARAALLFQAIEDENVIRPGQTEEQVSAAIYALAKASFGVEKHWHRRVVRSGPHTRLPFRELPPDRTIENDDIVSLDLGPVFGTHEADFGRSYVLGSDPEKLRLRSDLELLFVRCRDFYATRPEMTGAELYAYVVAACAERGWGFGGAHAGHLIGPFPFPRGVRDAARNRIRPDNAWPMNALAEDGEPRHWVLEIHLLDPSGAFGGFFEELLAPFASRSAAPTRR
jgi:Xaa-Pro aminopeptidase